MSALSWMMIQPLKRRLKAIAERRPPDQIIGTLEAPYLRRWYLIPRNRLFNIYLHQFCRSDDDRALHDHPWWNCSLLLQGSYVEHSIRDGGVNERVRREAGGFKLRAAKAAHRIELDAGPCWTLFLTGPRIREWGFHCAQGWRHWRVFTSNSGNVSSIGRGCGEDDDATGARAIVWRFLVERTRVAEGKSELLPSLYIDFTTWAGGPLATRAQFYAAMRERGGVIERDGVDIVEGIVLRGERE